MAEYAKSQGITVNKLETMLGASKGVFAKALKADGNTSTQWVENFCSVFTAISPEWLLLGSGDFEVKKECNQVPLCGDPVSLFYGGGKHSNQENSVMQGRIEQMERENRILKEDNKELNREVGRLEAKIEHYEGVEQKNEELIMEITELRNQVLTLRAQIKGLADSASSHTA